MASTTLLIALLLGMVVVELTIWILSLRLGLRWAKVKPEEVTRKRLILTVVWVFVFQMALLATVSWLLPSDGMFQREVMIAIVQNVTAALIACTVIARMFKAKPMQAFKTWLPTLAATIGLLLAFVFLIRPVTFEAFEPAASSMAPTVLGGTRSRRLP